MIKCSSLECVSDTHTSSPPASRRLKTSLAESGPSLTQTTLDSNLKPNRRVAPYQWRTALATEGVNSDQSEGVYFRATLRAIPSYIQKESVSSQATGIELIFVVWKILDEEEKV